MMNGMLEREKAIWSQVLTWIVLIGLTIVTLSIVTVGNWFQENISINKLVLHPGIYVLILSLLVFGIFTLLKKTQLIATKSLSIILLIAIVAVVIWTVVFLRIAPVFDGAVVSNQAYQLFNNPQWGDYFYQFPNNINIVTITYLLAKPWMSLHLIHNLQDFQLLSNAISNVLLILTIFMLADLVKKIRGRQALNVFLVLTLLMSPMLAVFFSELYTQQIAIVAMTASFFVLNLLVQGKHKYLNGLLFLFFSAMTILARPNMFLPYLIIVGLALFVYRVKVLKLILWCFMMFAMIGALKGAMNIYTQHIGYRSNPALTKQYELPVSAWFLTAYNYQGDGRNSAQTNAIIFHEPTKASKDAYIKDYLIKTVKQEGVGNTLNLYRRKTAVLHGWTSEYSMGYFSGRIGQAKLGWYNNYVRLIAWLADSALFVILCANLVYAVKLIRGKIAVNIPWLLLNLTAIALTAFYVLLWEVQESYAIPAIILLLAASAFTPFFQKRVTEN